ncbi:OmpH family outer membrane protein [Caulobacter sp. 17J80-11]|uniref:OmpH family outer membrane protein n=1 Tax=Caulobacter sp. 17J80-11 TaxID=2763502 RepID=UPI00165352B0|nr:OmpH family outer membrane protein [Caulobacter sp. 17J80-11]MBC6982063.1 OmpH family outer membrane protein [Caulobacter sp. 17J80-11]
MSIRRKLSALALVAALATPSLAAAQQAKVAYVDLERVLLEVRDGKAAQARLRTWLDARQKEIDAEQTALRAEKEALDKASPTMDAATREQKSADLKRKVVALSEKWERSRAEAAARESKEIEAILARYDRVAATIQRRDGLTIVDEQPSPPAPDITDEIVRAYDAANPGG